ncbi:protein translocase subunit SecD [Streptomyces clavuligerus]|uniref:protein translocase subunit SecD n=1 Tax=Streptomyces clavuligerus TaxID=1901 RepID=UPI000185162A|nr:protein translocase subunit SecD [Streptomyces clavuligerus]AXU15711.1 protein translocase subunit SecD [Streptomyces clavuligerus]MBY6305831.1 protein translocase subunit SecD [Streptomyces clavuligerus]QCS08490.1 protein translocase subunit SecD [Streptomyces clavuligerus]QPJ92173.1 protein translocase subunit SecD [Streptomyces clavuligerus]QPL65706.1 protein translocase subunit SecD [Streptomyces clavuligerus]
MAAPKRGRRPAGGQGKPGRTLVLILIALVALTGGMFATGDTTPRLGIDLAGGTTITLKAKAEPGKESAVNETNMNTAVGILERRVNGLGVSEAEVQTQGRSHIIVNIPKGTDSEQARRQVGTTAQLYFRPVLQVAAGAPVPQQPTPGASESGKPAEGKDAKDAKDGDKASPSASTGTSAQPGGSTPQGRAVTDALKDPSPGASEPGKPAEGAKDGKDGKDAAKTPDPAPTGDVAALQTAFATLNCEDQKARAAVTESARPENPMVSCGKNSAGQWEKYLLGPAEVDGKDVDDAKGQFDQNRGIWIVTMDFTDKGSKKFQKITSKLSQQQSPANQFAIVLDGEVVSAPQVNQTLTANAEISGSFNQKSAQELGNMLSYGALPLTFQEESVTTVSAALGGEQLRAGLIAGAIGLALVIIYLVAYYRGLAAIAILSLLVSAALTYVLMSLLGPAIGFALNLPAVCGAIVAIGITADSFIVYFERIRDEVREGRTLRPAVERAWPRARRTILVSDFVSFLAAAVLFIVTVGKVQGFAFTLGLTTLLDVVVVFFFTKPLMTLAARSKFFGGGHPWSGLDPKRLGVEPPLRRSRRTTVVTTDLKEA